MKFIIMVGGQGKKLWPVSRNSKPKQFIKLIAEKSLFQLNVESLLLKYKPEDIFISTSDTYVRYVREQAPKIPEKNYIIEPPLQKMTGPACGYSMLKVSMEHPDEVVMFYVQPVVVRTPAEKYLKTIDLIEKLVKTYGLLVTGGKYPQYPEVGSDYLELGEEVKKTGEIEVFSAKKFIERPKTLKGAEKLIKSKKLSLHCNHLTWTPKELLDAYKIYRPDWYRILMRIKDVFKKGGNYKELCKLYSDFEPGNVEKLTHNLFNNGKAQIVILPFDWTHITTWNDVFEYQKKYKINAIKGNVVEMDSKNNIILGKPGKLISTIGVENFVIIDTEDSLLICPKELIASIPKLLDEIDAKGYTEKL